MVQQQPHRRVHNGCACWVHHITRKPWNTEATEQVDIDKVLASSEVQLAGFDPWATGKALGRSERAVKFGLALLTGATKTASAKIAGFPGDGAVLRSAASKAARTRSM